MKLVSTDAPLSQLTLRKYESPENLSGRPLVKKLCLSLGLLQPGDSRDVVVDVLYVLLRAGGRKKELRVAEIEDQVTRNREKNKLEMQGIASSNIRRQLRRLRELFIIEKVKSTYRITEFAFLRQTYDSRVESFILQNISARVKQYLDRIDSEFMRQEPAQPTSS